MDLSTKTALPPPRCLVFASQTLHLLFLPGFFPSLPDILVSGGDPEVLVTGDDPDIISSDGADPDVISGDRGRFRCNFR